MSDLSLSERYRRATRRVTSAPRLIVDSPGRLARRLRDLVRQADGLVWLLADLNTAAAAPEIVDALPPDRATILPGAPRVVPEIELAERVADEATSAGSRLLVSIGGGTITDLAKYAVRIGRLELVCVPTAASVDAYTSARSALRIEGYHRTPDCRVPDVILVAPAIVAAAPHELTLAGIGDLVAKLIARLDWELGAIVTGEGFSRREAEWSARAARTALARLRHAGLEAAALAGLDALLLTGRTMRVFGSSRPAASSEHTIAHLWEVAIGEEVESLHGLLVVRAAYEIVRAYGWVVERLVADGGAAGVTAAEVAGLEACWQERVPDDMRPFLGKMREESAGRAVAEASVVERRGRIRARRAEIVGLASRALSDVRRGLDALETAGIAAHLPPIPERWRRRGVEWVKYLRNRYSMFDLAFELGWEGELFEDLNANR